MGKYLRKTKTAAEISVMEFCQSSHGVRTRAKALALQKASSSPAQPPVVDGTGCSYLQLRSRRLQKRPVLLIRSPKRRKQATKEPCAQNPNPNPNSQNSNSPVNSSRGESGSGSVAVAVTKPEIENVAPGEVKEEKIGSGKETSCEDNEDLGVEASFGENVLEIERRERTTRESTPCSLIRDPETIRTPGSTTKHNNSLTGKSQRAQSSSVRHLPRAHEMDEFFAGAEEEQQRRFVEKYNFDPVNDKPLPGRYKWEKIDHEKGVYNFT